jgi:hypothetical protein
MRGRRPLGRWLFENAAPGGSSLRQSRLADGFCSRLQRRHRRDVVTVTVNINDLNQFHRYSALLH